MIDIGPLSLDEIQLILDRRNKEEEAAWLRAKQSKCKHTNTRYVGHSHNDDAYECLECRDIIWR